MTYRDLRYKENFFQCARQDSNLRPSLFVVIFLVLAALAIWQYAEASAYLIFGDRTGDMVADEIIEALKDVGDEGMPRTEIHDLFGRHLKSRVLGAVLRDLEAQGRIYRKKMPKGEGAGRPPEVWRIRDE